MADRTTSAAVAAGGLGAAATVAGAAGLRAALRAASASGSSACAARSRRPACGASPGAEIDLAADHLAGREGGDSEERVHEARKALKRLADHGASGARRPRATGYGGARTHVARRGTAPGGARDAAVMLETPRCYLTRALSERGALLERLPGCALVSPLPTSGAGRSGGLARSRRRAGRAGGGPRAVAGWTPAGRSDFLSAGLRRIYRRGRRAYLEARENPTAERLHEWRKRVKDPVARGADPAPGGPQAPAPPRPRRPRPVRSPGRRPRPRGSARRGAARSARVLLVDSTDETRPTALIDRRRAEVRQPRSVWGDVRCAQAAQARRGWRVDPSVG